MHMYYVLYIVCLNPLWYVYMWNTNIRHVCTYILYILYIFVYACVLCIFPVRNVSCAGQHWHGGNKTRKQSSCMQKACVYTNLPNACPKFEHVIWFSTSQRLHKTCPRRNLNLQMLALSMGTCRRTHTCKKSMLWSCSSCMPCSFEVGIYLTELKIQSARFGNKRHMAMSQAKTMHKGQPWSL